MNVKRAMLIVSTVMPLAGCSTYQGGTTDDYMTGTGSNPGNPEPAAAPSMRPGMNPYDPRDQFYKPGEPGTVAPPPSSTF
jgi:hypothetical protein